MTLISSKRLNINLPTQKYLVTSLIFLLLLMFFLLGTNVQHYAGLFRGGLDYDEGSYLSHGFTIGLDFNLKYEQLISITKWKAETGVAAHPIGPGLLAAPFIAFFSIFDRLNNDEVIENHKNYLYSWSAFGFAFSSYLFFILSLFLNIHAIKYLGFALPKWEYLLVSSSYGILQYVLIRPFMGHASEAFILALCFWACCRAYHAFLHKKITSFYIFICALSIVLSLQIRPSNLNVLLLPLIVFGFNLTTNHKPKINTKLIYPYFFFYISFLLICYIPFGYLNYHLYKQIYPTSNVMYGQGINPVPSFATLHDVYAAFTYVLSHLYQIFTICFSSEFGIAFNSSIIFFWYPFYYLFYFKKILFS